MRHNRQHHVMVFVLTLCLLLVAAQGWSAVNVGMGNMGADPTTPDNDLITDSAPLTVNSTKLTVLKRAFVDDNSGTEIPSGSTVPKGTIVKFVIYVDNTTNSQVGDLRIVDQLDKTGFTYQAGSLRWNSGTTATGGAIAAIFTDTNNGVALTDAISNADAGSVDLTPATYAQITFGGHSTQANAAVTIPAGRIAAFMFRARVN